MKKIITIISLVSVLVSSISARAADHIMHFWASVGVPMLAGVDPDFAVAMGVGNEMIDKGYWTHPMGLPTPRLLLHFLGTPLEFSVDEGALKRGLALATIKHPLFYNLLQIGIKEKNPVHLGKALHLLIDTFYHAGYSNLLGHGEGGKRPDMPYEEVQKARQCFQAIIEVIFLIRDMRPGSPDLSYLERVITDVTKNQIYRDQLEKVTQSTDIKVMTAYIAKKPHLFTQILLDHPLFRNAFFTNVEKSNAYWDIALDEVFKQFKDKGYSNLENEDLVNLKNLLRDITARTDIDPTQSLKIVIYRILQLQDPVLSEYLKNDLGNLGYDINEIKSLLDKAHFDFSKLEGYSDIESFKTAIEVEAMQNKDHLRMLIANLKIFKNNVSHNGVFLPSPYWQATANTMAEQILPELLSWDRLFKEPGIARLVEHRDVGILFSSQTHTDFMKSLIDKDPGYIDKMIEVLESIERDPKLLEIAGKMRALAETAYRLSNNATKDMFPGKLSPIKKVVYEDTSLRHSIFAQKLREQAQVNLWAELVGMKFVKGPDSFFEFMKGKVQVALSKLKFEKVKSDISHQMVETDQLLRESLLEMGLAKVVTRDGQSVIETIAEQKQNSFEVKPNLTLFGYADWFWKSFTYIGPVMFKFFGAKNRKVLEYIAKGEVMKSEVVQAVQKMYYSNATAENPLLTKYGPIVDKEKPGKGYGVSGLPGSGGLKCIQLMSSSR